MKTPKDARPEELSRMGVRLSNEVFARMEAAMPALKREARRQGSKMTQQLFVEQAIEHYLDYLEGKPLGKPARMRA